MLNVWTKFHSLETKKPRYFVQEKVDGSNFAIQKDEDGKLHYFRRGGEIDLEDESVDLVFKHLREIENSSYFDKIEIGLVYYGEALGMARLPYNKTHFGEFYFFDIKDEKGYWPPMRSNKYFEGLGMPSIPYEFVDLDDISEYLKISKKSFIDGESTIEGYVYRTNDKTYKEVHKHMKEDKTSRVTPNDNYYKKWVIKWTKEEPLDNYSEFFEKCNEDFKNEQKTSIHKKPFLKDLKRLAKIEYETKTLENGRTIEIPIKVLGFK